MLGIGGGVVIVPLLVFLFSAQHLPLYIAEFEHRHNCRKMTDGERTDAGLQMATGKRLIYKPANL